MHDLASLGIQTSRRFQHFIQTVLHWEEVKSEISGSPGSRQLLQLQHFPKIQKISGPSSCLFWVHFFLFGLTILQKDYS